MEAPKSSTLLGVFFVPLVWCFSIPCNPARVFFVLGVSVDGHSTPSPQIWFEKWGRKSVLGLNKTLQWTAYRRLDNMFYEDVIKSIDVDMTCCATMLTTCLKIKPLLKGRGVWLVKNVRDIEEQLCLEVRSQNSAQDAHQHNKRFLVSGSSSFSRLARCSSPKLSWELLDIITLTLRIVTSNIMSTSHIKLNFLV